MSRGKKILSFYDDEDFGGGGRAPRKPPDRFKVTLTTHSGGDVGVHRLGVNALAYSDQEGVLYSGGRDGCIRQWDVQGAGAPGRCRQLFQGHNDWVTGVVSTADGRNMVSCSHDTSLKVWHANSFQPGNGEEGAIKLCRPICSMVHHTDYVKGIAYSPASGQVASVGLDGNLFVWDLGGGGNSTFPSFSVTEEIDDGHKNSIYAVAISADGNMVVTGGTEETVRVWDLRQRGGARRKRNNSSTAAVELEGHKGTIRCVSFVEGNGNLCLSGGSDCTLNAWDIRMGTSLFSAKCHDDSLWAMAVDGRGQSVFTGSRGGGCPHRPWDRGQRTRRLRERSDPLPPAQELAEDPALGVDRGLVHPGREGHPGGQAGREDPRRGRDRQAPGPGKPNGSRDDGQHGPAERVHMERDDREDHKGLPEAGGRRLSTDRGDPRVRPGAGGRGRSRQEEAKEAFLETARPPTEMVQRFLLVREPVHPAGRTGMLQVCT